ncbi:MAG: pantoate--beta-alanine ligase [Flavobacteriaceae bacterium]|nr:pantoate--beta-alanine ligase [Flavobacteriaceae bacterium]
MNLFENKYELQEQLNKLNFSSLGFVPTMGALHQGHLSLLERSIQDNNLTVLSLFINPTQFNNLQDLENYPKTFNQDITILNRYRKNILIFMPNTYEIYGKHVRAEQFDLQYLDKHMEGKSRPNHFQGVITVMNILLKIINPTKIYLGEKDFQQLQIIRLMREKLNWKTKIIGCPTIRESDGLAMSSRNVLLSPPQRREAQLIYQILKLAKKQVMHMPVEELKRVVTKKINQTQYLELDYFEIIEKDFLQPVSELIKGKSYQCCIAVYAGDIRLIDNLAVSL